MDVGRFPPPGIFTNALLGHHEITTLIRDTEPHERALFSVDPNAINSSDLKGPRRTATFGGEGQGRRKTVQPGQQRQTSAVAKVLGSAMLKQIQQSSRSNGKRGINVEVLLQGAEKLCAIYPVAGADQRISALRTRHSRIAESVLEYESKVMRQQTRLNRANHNAELDDHVEVEQKDVLYMMTEDDLRAEEDEIRELEVKKKMLEERIAGMERDLGGLLQ